jgi:hypothetical protein
MNKIVLDFNDNYEFGCRGINLIVAKHHPQNVSRGLYFNGQKVEAETVRIRTNKNGSLTVWLSRRETDAESQDHNQAGLEPPAPKAE